MLLLASSPEKEQQYVNFERPAEVASYAMKGLGYFKRALGMSDYLERFQSWIAREGPLFLGCLVDNALVGWCMFERWEKNDKDDTPIYVLRMIEVSREHRKQHIGISLMTLVFHIAPGHIVTRPLSKNAEQFFRHLGFIRPPDNAQIDFRDKYGYLLLPSAVKHALNQTLKNSALKINNETVQRCADALKTSVLRDSLSNTQSFAQAFITTLKKPNFFREGQKVFIKTDTSKSSCLCGSQTISFYTVESGTEEYLSVECQRCGDVWLTVPI